MKPKVKLFLADNYFLFVEGLSIMLATSDDFEVVGMARNMQETIYKLQKTTCHVLLIDANFFFQGNVHLVKELKEIHSQKILVLHDSMDMNCLRKIHQQVDGFLSKLSTRYQLFDTIQAISEGEKQNKAGIKTFSVNTAYREELVGRYQLTHRELEVIRLIALEFISSEIATKLCVSEFTVDTYRKNITKKLKARNIASIVNFAHRWQLV